LSRHAGFFSSDVIRRIMSMQASSFAEKDFYLDEFRGKSLLFALRAADLSSGADREVAGEVLRTLLLQRHQGVIAA